jgi:hypothetical protein
MTIVTQATAPAPWTQSTDAVSAIYDLFPAEVTTPTGRYNKVRMMMLTFPSPRLLVFADTAKGPAAVIDAVFDPASVYGDTASGFDVYAALDPSAPATASVVAIRPMSGCGCGSRLGSGNFQPFTTMRQSAPPASKGPLPAPPVLPTP